MTDMTPAKRLYISAFPDGTTYLIFLDDLDSGERQTIEGVIASSEEDAITKTLDAMTKSVREVFGDGVSVTVETPEQHDE